jgi:DNA-binding response OmpR family regulator
MSSLRSAEAVLIVDGDPALRNLVQSLLEREGYMTLLAGSASEARVVFLEHSDRIGLLVTDMDIPGPEIARQLRRLKPNLQVLCMAASSEGFDQPVEGLTTVPKPFTIREFVGRVREALPKKREAATETPTNRELKSG